MKNSNIKKDKIIPIFYASDVNYLPYLSVSIKSLKENANKNFIYRLYVLHTGIDVCHQKKFFALNEQGFKISFVNVAEKLKEIKRELQLRDYYTGATYYRIFIANMFPQYDKALYLDGDTVILGDISQLYGIELHDNLVGAVTDAVVSGNAVFRRYTSEVLDIQANKYFNAGVLLMNLKKFRTDGFYNQFRALLSEYKFSVAQDQDYLNVICKDKVKFIPYCWNTMPIDSESKKEPFIIHYNLTLKPWHYADVPYAKYFWSYAKQSDYYADIRREFGNFSLELQEKDAVTEMNLIALALSECEREDNFIKSRIRNRKNFQVSFFKDFCCNSQDNSQTYSCDDTLIAEAKR